VTGGRPSRIRTLLIVIAAFAGAFGLVRGFFGLDDLDRILVVVVGGATLASLLFISGTTSVARLVARRIDPCFRDKSDLE
jgi:hypothetical protein